MDVCFRYSTFFHSRIRICDTAFQLTKSRRPSQRSAFFLFFADFRQKVKTDTPGLSIGDTAKKLGEMWNNSSPEDKQPYEKKASKLKEKYDKVREPNPTPTPWMGFIPM